eukprot:2964302-Rhodomonas_salina.1
METERRVCPRAIAPGEASASLGVVSYPGASTKPRPPPGPSHIIESKTSNTVFDSLLLRGTRFRVPGRRRRALPRGG